MAAAVHADRSGPRRAGLVGFFQQLSDPEPVPPVPRLGLLQAYAGVGDSARARAAHEVLARLHPTLALARFRQRDGPRRRLSVSGRWRVAALLCVLLLRGAVCADESDRPHILHVAVSGRPVAGRGAEARLTYHARQANVVAVVLVVEDLEGPRRVTSQREIGVTAAAFGREEGDLVVPLGFATPGRKRVVFTLLTDEREESDSASVEVVVAP